MTQIAKRRASAPHRSLASYLGEVFMLLMCAAVIFPFYYLIINTFKTAKDATFNPLSLPQVWTLEAYVKAFDKMNFFQSLFNTVFFTASGTLLIIVLGSMAAYACARRNTRYTRLITLYFLFGFAVPSQTTLLPLFTLMRAFGLTNSYLGMVLLYSSGCTFAFFMYLGFIKTVPYELEEAAIIDGCSVPRIFWQVTFPLLQPTTLTVGIFQAIWIWNDFINANIFLSRKNMRTLVLEVFNGMGQFRNDWSLMLTIMVIVLAPIVAFYIFTQRYIIDGMVAGAVKG